MYVNLNIEISCDHKAQLKKLICIELLQILLIHTYYNFKF